MKKISVLLAAILSVSMLYCFVACGNKPMDNNDVTITMSVSSLNMNVGDTQKVTVSVTPADVADKTITWKSSNDAIVTVADGVITAKSEGKAIVTAMTNGKEATCAVTVKAPASQSSPDGMPNDPTQEPENGSDSNPDGPSDTQESPEDMLD